MDRVRWTARIAFGLGSYAEGLKNGAFLFFVLFYYNQVLGLPASVAGLALAAALVVDAVTDPLVGSISDHFRSSWGRRHPFMYASALPYAVVFYLLFVPPAGLSPTGLFVWLLTFAVATRVALTIYSVPHMTLAAELSQDYDERTTLASVRSLLSIGGIGSATLGGFALFFTDDRQLDATAYPPFALTLAILMVVTIVYSGVGTHSYIPRLMGPSARGEGFSLRGLASELWATLSIRPFRRLLAAMVTYAAVNGLSSALSTYVLTFFFRLEGLTLGLQLSIGIGGGVAGAAIASPLAARIGNKRNTMMLGLLWYSVFTGSIVTLRLLGWAPANGDPLLLPLLLSTAFVGGSGIGVVSVLTTSMIADVTDEHERIHRARQEGIYYSTVSFINKVTTGLGTVLAGVAIDLVGLDPSVLPDEVSSAALWGLGFVYGPVASLLMLVPVALVFPYDIDRARHRDILDEIAASKGAHGGEPPSGGAASADH